jgi:N-acetyl-gamma-glutamyl-phosphate reductase
MVRVGVVGATGYTGEEIVRVLSGHPLVRLTALSAIVEKEEPISKIFPSLAGKTDLVCKRPNTDETISKVDLVFLALPHRVSMEAAPKFLIAGKKVIDLSADYRLPPDVYKAWYGVEHKDKENIGKAVYGLPELYAEKIKTAKLVANPGCYPTSVLLGLAPALADGCVKSEFIIADSKSGVTGAGRKADVALSFGEVDENIKAYKANEHQHKPEINKIASELAGEKVDVVFTPHLVPLNRGILSTLYMRLRKGMETKDALDLYRKFYRGKPFVRICDEGIFPQLRNVFMTNCCDVGLKVTGDVLIVVSCIDNLMKGAAGQAAQNMNLMCGFEETEGLR